MTPSPASSSAPSSRDDHRRQVTHPDRARLPSAQGFYPQLVETKALPASPAADRKFFVGKRQRKGSASYPYFTQEEGPTLFAAAKELHPRWQPFILTGLLAGLRWGEAASLFKSDIDFKRGYTNVQRTVSRDVTFSRPKDNDMRRIKLSPALAKALKAHIEAMDLEGSVKDWTPEARRLVFPTQLDRVVQYAVVLTTVWQSLLAAAKVPYRKYHSTRHLRDLAAVRQRRHPLGQQADGPCVDQPDGGRVRTLPAREARVSCRRPRQVRDRVVPPHRFGLGAACRER